MNGLVLSSHKKIKQDKEKRGNCVEGVCSLTYSKLLVCPSHSDACAS